MSNVTQLRRLTDRSIYDGPGGDAMLAHDLNSPIMFKAFERPLYYEGKNGDKFGNTNHKALVRMLNDAPYCLNVVRDTYKVVQNDELFAAIHRGLANGLSRDELSSARIRDKIAYGGAQCFREYIFPDIAVESPERDKIAFRVVVQNGFGTGSIKVLAGAIDFFCTNGIVIGEYTRTYVKHTKGLQISRFEEVVRGSVQLFWKQRDFYGDLAKRKVLNDDAVLGFYIQHFGERLGHRLHHQYLTEAAKRGNNLWAVYSALTYYASHNAGEFSLRNTGNDHAAATMMQRENNVRKVIGNGEILKGLAA